MLRFLEIRHIPNVQFSILTSGSDQVTIQRRDINSIDVVLMSLQGESNGEVQVPDFEPAVPSYTDEVGSNPNILLLG